MIEPYIFNSKDQWYTPPQGAIYTEMTPRLPTIDENEPTSGNIVKTEDDNTYVNQKVLDKLAVAKEKRRYNNLVKAENNHQAAINKLEAEYEAFDKRINEQLHDIAEIRAAKIADELAAEQRRQQEEAIAIEERLATNHFKVQPKPSLNGDSSSGSKDGEPAVDNESDDTKSDQSAVNTQSGNDTATAADNVEAAPANVASTDDGESSQDKVGNIVVDDVRQARIACFDTSKQTTEDELLSEDSSVSDDPLSSGQGKKYFFFF